MSPALPHYQYKAVLADSLKVDWRVEELINAEKTLDFTQPFLPESLAGTAGISCLSAAEKLKLNQIRGHGYLHMFTLAESFILPYVLERTEEVVASEDPCEVRALTNFADEEAKHMHLFARFAQEFARGFGTPCGVIGPLPELARAVLGHGHLAVGLLILHLEWLTQRHFLDAVRSGEPIDPRFMDLLRHHWMEEAQHAKLDTLILERLAGALSPADIEAGIDEYLGLCETLDGLLANQVELDLQSLTRATGRAFTPAETREISAAQHRSYRWTFIGSGIVHPNFVAFLGQLTPRGQARVAERAPAWC